MWVQRNTRNQICKHTLLATNLAETLGWCPHNQPTTRPNACARLRFFLPASVPPCALLRHQPYFR